MLTKRAAEILDLMLEAEMRQDYEGAEIVCDGLSCYLGEMLVSRRTVTNLIRHVAVSLASEPGGMERYTVSGTGRKIAADPSVADRIVAALEAGIACDESGNPIPRIS